MTARNIMLRVAEKFDNRAACLGIALCFYLLSQALTFYFVTRR